MGGLWRRSSALWLQRLLELAHLMMLLLLLLLLMVMVRLMLHSCFLLLLLFFFYFLFFIFLLLFTLLLIIIFFFLLFAELRAAERHHAVPKGHRGAPPARAGRDGCAWGERHMLHGDRGSVPGLSPEAASCSRARR